ncbi:MAG: tolB protein precursor, periplasmic protein involved in the tonb-independent uptake of group A colicins, partial [uncultured Sphingomonadaceae bacterium]
DQRHCCPIPAAPLNDRACTGEGQEEVGRGRPTRDEDAPGADQRQRRHVDERGREPGRAHDRLRSAGRHLHDADLRRPGDADRERPAVRGSAAFLARWAADRLHVRSGRRRQYLDHEHRRIGQAAAHQGDLHAPQQPDLEPGRPLHRGAQAFHDSAIGRHRRGVDVPCGWRQRRGTGRAAQPAAPEGAWRADFHSGRRRNLLQ